MSHDPTKVLMGSTQSSFRTVDSKKGTVAAGLIVRLKDDDTLSTASADGAPLGISLGGDLSDIGRTAIVRRGTMVPVHLTDAFTPVIGAQVHISNTTGRAMASGGTATGMNAKYRSGVLDGVLADGSVIRVALIDFEGGL